MSGKILKFRNYRPVDTSLSGADEKAARAELPSVGATQNIQTPSKQAAPGPARQQCATITDARSSGEHASHEAAKNLRKRPEANEDVIKRELRKHQQQHGSEQLNVASRKPNWDLKRDVTQKMEKLNKVTQRAIVDLLREKLAKEAAEESEDGTSSEEDE